ncbi:MAG: peptidase C11 [Firmicutes bacterium]|nr:peptidase C11 [Bacillota bacterium]
MERNRPRSRERFTSEEGKGIQRKGEGRGTGRRGADSGALGEILGGIAGGISERAAEKPEDKDDIDQGPIDFTRSPGNGQTPPGGQTRSAGQGMPRGYAQPAQSYNANTKRGHGGNKGCRLIAILAAVIAVILLFMIVGTVLRSGGSGGAIPNSGSSSGSSASSGGSGSGSGTSGSTTPSSNNGFTPGWQTASNVGVLNTEVDPAARAKFTQLKGDGKDSVTIFVYMCGTDLESSAAMASRDLQEMLNADISDKVNIVIYTGGCNKWQNNVMANGINQIYRISSTGLARLNDNAGKYVMTDYSTLASFLKWGVQNYPADRNILIFWDHGGGSVVGYGYDERSPRSGSMMLDGISAAIRSCGTTFDIIGFDACLMATTETALMLGDYADYMLASEEVEPGIGWYYTNWLTQLSKNTSLSSLELGKTIADDFTSACQQSTPGQSTTLSLIDLSELSQTLPDVFASFANETNGLIESGDYRSVANARAASREFSPSNRIDQIDLVHFAALLETGASDPLISAVRSAVKYNRASRDMTNSFGLSIFFPYRKLSYVDIMTKIYGAIGIDKTYSTCIKHFAQMQASGQTVGSGSANPYGSLFGYDTGSGASGSSGADSWPGWYDNSSYGSSLTEEAMLSLLQQLLGGGLRDFGAVGFTDLDRSNTEFLSSEALDPHTVASYIRKNMLDKSDVEWENNGSGDIAVMLTDEQWDLVEGVDMAMYVDDGGGYIELGLDNTYDFDDAGNLLPVLEKTWLAINDQTVAYYHTDTFENGDEYRISGRVPVEINGIPADLILVFDNDRPQGYVSGIQFSYKDGETEAGAKIINSLDVPAEDFTGEFVKVFGEDAKITFICDYFNYNGTYQDSYELGDPITVADLADLTITNAPVGDWPVKVIYRFTDIYGQNIWTPALDL